MGEKEKEEKEEQESRAGWKPAPVRLRACVVRGVKVPLRHALRPLTERNCVAVRRGGKQREVNDQSVG